MRPFLSLRLHSLLEALTSKQEEALLQLQFNLPQGADKTNVMRVVSQSRKLRGHASQTALCQHVRNLSGASLSMAFYSMKQLNRQGKQYWCKHELAPRHVETILARCIIENVVGQLVRTPNTSRVLPIAISPHLYQTTAALEQRWMTTIEEYWISNLTTNLICRQLIHGAHDGALRSMCWPCFGSNASLGNASLCRMSLSQSQTQSCNYKGIV